MKLDAYLKDKVAAVFESVEYGRITFFLSPNKQTLNYTIERSEEIPLAPYKKDFFQKNTEKVLTK